jgi:hypothetical protein
MKGFLLLQRVTNFESNDSMACSSRVGCNEISTFSTENVLYVSLLPNSLVGEFIKMGSMFEPRSIQEQPSNYGVRGQNGPLDVAEGISTDRDEREPLNWMAVFVGTR